MSVVFVLFRWSTSFFSVTRDLSTPIKVPIKQFTFAEEDSVENLSALIHASYSCQSENWKKCCSYCFRSIINLVCLRHYIFEFLKRDLKWKQYHCRGILKWQLVDYVPCIRILIVPIFRRKNFSFAFLDIQIQLHISPIPTSSISSIKLQTKSFLIKKDLVGFLLISFLATEAC